MTTTTMQAELERKLDPRRFTAMSGKMAAIVGFILNTERWVTEPAIAELVITSSDGLLARHRGDIGANDFLGSAEDLDRNIRNLMKAAELTPAERRAFTKMRRERITTFGYRERLAVGR